jgi:hypothetical protein
MKKVIVIVGMLLCVALRGAEARSSSHSSSHSSGARSSSHSYRSSGSSHGTHLRSYSHTAAHSSHAYHHSSGLHYHASTRSHYYASTSRYASGVARDSHGRIARSSAAKYAFEAETGHPHGWPGHVVDHVVPLKHGGADDPSNMQWQTKEDAKAKDRWE